ncbi:protein phyllopod [Zeugodacus cucurbitae]|uniref:Protein phyllopod n=1 Tax=Zeugodacus cucurbitae TaxID=28588 RepID=A0A0A1X902_ZEUCU|nr:protein phyllopod [Zeugodacus cucurbitae]
MSEKSSEFLKRTCLICGCHTNQTINIYEPRSGPNIVELIQAKFKFQPLNEDKYLCFSCNNWLINWHSLQALNSNDAESPSGTFRPQMNSMLHKENAENQPQQSRNMCHWQTNAHLCRPIAKVLPSITAKARDNGVMCEVLLTKDTMAHSVREESLNEKKGVYTKIFKPKCRHRLCYAKPKRLSKNLRLRQKHVQYKTSVGCSTNQAHQANNKSIALCEEQNIANDFVYNSNEHKNIFTKLDDHALVMDNNHWLKRPLVDGKVVSMLRRLGTTLSHELRQKSTSSSTLSVTQIMSPTKSKPRWTRQLDEDEILLDFNSAISEVLPQVIGAQQQQFGDKYCVPEVMAVKQARRKLTYQVSVDEDVSQYIYPVLPEGLSISLV